MAFKIFKTPRTIDFMQDSITIAFWFDEGIVEEDARFILDILSPISVNHISILQPSWLLVVCPDNAEVRHEVQDVLISVLKKRDQDGFSGDLRIGIQLGPVLMSLDQNGMSQTHPVGLPVSVAMKRARESSSHAPCVGLDDLN